MTNRASVACWSVALLAGLIAGCSTGLSVVGGAVDAGADAGESDLGAVVDAAKDAADVPGMDAVDVPGMDAVDAQGMDVPADVPPDAPTRCTSSADCAGNPAGATCDVDSGRCVPCLPSADTCPVGQFCSGTTCVPGCRNDEACGSPGSADAGVDAGALPSARRCNVATRACVECVADEHCPSGMLCVGNVCVMGCTDARPCPGILSCCTGACVDTVSNVASCGACGTRCSVPNATAACQNGMCTVGTCISPFADCDRAPANGCEANTLMDISHCGACGNACAARPHAVGRCDAGRCAYSCEAGFDDCDGNPDNGCEVDVRSDVAHCGRCAAACDLPNASATCVERVCAVAACAPGWGNCDGNASNGCEVDLRNSVPHCGRCGGACAARPNAFPGCVGGECFTSCFMGFQDCDGMDANGCEVDTRSSPTNCGACGRVCAPSNATGACMSGGRCTVTACDTGFADCDGDANNGCEVNLNSDVANCGTCRRACTAMGGTPACLAGTCGLTSCGTGLADCDRSGDSCETSTASDPRNCGGCGSVCDLANATAGCAGGRCTVMACNAGFADCDGNAANGCEVNLRADNLHCGACNARCAPANGAGACVAGACTVAACNAGFSDCDGNAANGCEVSLASDSAHCGACNARCALANATSACASGGCLVASCNGGFADCNSSASDGCEVNVNTTPTSCGSCGRACALPNASGVGCAGGSCTVTMCVGGFGNCDGNASNGCESNLSSDPSNCGACGSVPAEACNLADDNCNGRCDDTSGCRVAVYRYRNVSSGEHFYTISRGEVGGAQWVTEGDPAYYLYASDAGGMLPFYRCRWSGKHFYTTSSACESASGAVLEGLMGYIATTDRCGSTALHRLYRNANGDHFYTPSTSERDTAIGGGYGSEGVSGYVWLAPGG